MKDAWQQIRTILEKGLNPSIYSLWIKPLEADLRQESLALLAPNDFVAAWVRERLLVQIREAATQVLGAAPELSVTARRQEAPTVPLRAQALTLPLPMAPVLARPGASHAWRHSFSDFVVGPNNDLAYAASRGILKEQFGSNQLYLCSAAGLGKTHLIQAIGHAALTEGNRRQVNIRYLTAEEFATRMILSLRAGEISRFKAAFREGVDILLLEDIHFLQGKAKIQDEMLATLKALRERGSRVVFTSSFLPKELTDMDGHLLSRFSQAMLAHIDKPDIATRMRILEAKATKLQCSVPQDVSRYLAEYLSGDIRQLESCLQNLVLKARLLNHSLNLGMAREVVGHYAADQDTGLARIVRSVCEAFNLSQNELVSKSRKRQIVLARNTAFFLARKHTDLSLKDIGSHFGRSHSTVIKGITSLEREMSIRSPQGHQIKRTLDQLDLH